LEIAEYAMRWPRQWARDGQCRRRGL